MARVGKSNGEDVVLREIALPGNGEPAPQVRERMVSLDAFRGATIAAMIVVNNPGRWALVYSPLRETEWHGWTFADCIFPAFLFIMGIAIVFSFENRSESGRLDKKTVLRIMRRTGILFLLGLLLNGFPYYHLYDLRIPGVLQRIAVCYLAVSLITLKTRINSQVCVLAGLLISYWMLLEFIPVPGVGAGLLEPGRNLASYVDGLLLPGHLWYNIRPYDPEGILSTIPAIGTTLFGVLTGHWLRSSRGIEEKTTGMLIAGLMLLILGQILNLWIPINKGIWTSSYAVSVAGISLVCLAIFCWLIDVKGYKKAATPFVIFGMNAIAAYVLSELISKTIRVLEVTRADGRRTTLRRFIFDTVFTPVAGGKLASLMFAVCFTFVIFLVMWVMWKKRWLLKV